MQTLIAAILQLYNLSQQHRELLLRQYSNNALVVQLRNRDTSLFVTF